MPPTDRFWLCHYFLLHDLLSFSESTNNPSQVEFGFFSLPVSHLKILDNVVVAVAVVVVVVVVVVVAVVVAVVFVVVLAVFVGFFANIVVFTCNCSCCSSCGSQLVVVVVFLVSVAVAAGLSVGIIVLIAAMLCTFLPTHVVLSTLQQLQQQPNYYYYYYNHYGWYFRPSDNGSPLVIAGLAHWPYTRTTCIAEENNSFVIAKTINQSIIKHTHDNIANYSTAKKTTTMKKCS